MTATAHNPWVGTQALASAQEGTVETLLAQHEQARLESINLIVSENRMSRRARAPLSSDIQSRYAAGFYSGTAAAQELVSYVADSAGTLFRASHANLAPVSGNMSLLAVMHGLTRVGDRIGRVPPFFPGGGYPFNYEAFDRVPLALPFSEKDWQLNLDATSELLKRERPPLVVLGASIVTYPMPVREVAEVVHGYGGIVAYDGSHCLGLIAGGQYQDPLREGADILFGSTHKTFPGPQGGIVLTNDSVLHQRVESMANLRPLKGPTLVCNPHLARIAATGIVLEETDWQRYAAQIVANAQTMARVLFEEGIPLHGASAPGFTELTYCHQVITGYERSLSGKLRNHLARHRVNVDAFVRIGTAEITRLGYGVDECSELARVVAYLLQNQKGDFSDVDRRIQHLVTRHREVVL